jgi:SSS family solute:Na+ symporter
MDTIVGSGDGSLIPIFILGLALFAVSYSLWGGLSAVAWTDVVQVFMLVLGGLVASYIALDHVTPNGGVINGLSHIYNVAGDKFHMILKKDNPQFSNLPGIAVLIGGMWIANLYYWGFNQYIIQRALAAKSLREAQKGLAFAAFMKIILPLLVVIPGIIAYVMYMQPEGTTIINGVKDAFANANGTLNYDKAYPWLISTFIPIGFKGLVVAALVAAIVSSLASMLNSTATIFTMDIFKPYFGKKATDKKLVNVGRISSLTALLIACILAPLLGSVGQMFQYIQEYTGLVSPGVLAVFLMGLFWKKTSTKGAIAGVLLSIPVALSLKFLPIEMPFLDQMFYTCIITIAIIIGVSLTSTQGDDNPKALPLLHETFITDKAFNICAYIVLIIVAVLYAVFW